MRRSIRFGWTAPDDEPRDVLVRLDTVTDLARRRDLGPFWMQPAGGRSYALDVDLDDGWTVLYQFHVSTGRRAEIERSAATDRSTWRRVIDEAVPDPANPASARQPHVAHPTSVLDLAGATTRCPVWPPLDRPPALAEHRVASDRLGERRVWTHLAGDGPPAALLVLFDGAVWAHDAPIAPLLDAEVAAGRLPALGVVLVDEGDPEQRAADLSASDAFADLVADQVVPLAAHTFGVTPAPSRTIAAGQSLGGLAAVHLALRRPDVVGVALSQSGSFWFPDPASTGPDGAIQRDVRDGPQRPVRVHLQVGAMEESLLGPNRGLRDALAGRGYDLSWEVFGGGHGHLWWYLHLPAGLAAGLADQIL